MVRLLILWAYVRSSIARDLRRPGPLVVLMGTAVVSNSLFLAFWTIFLVKVSPLPGFDTQNMVELWALTTIGFGTAFLLLGNATELPSMIYRGELDAFLLLPSRPLLPLLLNETRTAYLADIGFGVVIFAVFGEPTPVRTLQLLYAVLVTALIVGAFTVVVGSLAFWLRNADTFGGHLIGTFLNCATYPGTVFHGGWRLALYTAIPAGYINLLPVHLIGELSPGYVVLITAAAVAAPLMARGVFYTGLRRYESGSTPVSRL